MKISPANKNNFLSKIQIKLHLASSCPGTPNFQADVIQGEKGLGTIPDKINRHEQLLGKTG